MGRRIPYDPDTWHRGMSGLFGDSDYVTSTFVSGRPPNGKVYFPEAVAPLERKTVDKVER
jgi:hypothetical protein